MSNLRFVHAADLHLDSPFTGLRSTNAEVSRHLCEATFDAYSSIIDLCLEERVDALLVAGDLYDGADRSLRAQLKFLDGLERLQEAGIRSFICHGNHDPLSGWEARLRLPDGCHAFGPEVEAVPLDPSDPLRATVCGVSYPKRDVRENLALQFNGVRPDSAFAIGLLHCNLGGNTEHEVYAPCSIEDLARSGIDYWALGHVHTAQIAHEHGPVVVYPGNPQGRNPRETGPHGVYLVDVSESGAVHLEFRAMDRVRWGHAELSIDDLEDAQGLLDGASASAERLLEQADGRHLVYRLRIRGRGHVHTALQQDGFADDLQERVNELWSAQAPFAWCERVEVATSPALDRAERQKAGDFVGDLLKYVDSVVADDAKLADIGTQLQELYGHTRAKRYLSQAAPTEDELHKLVAEAETRCLDHLEEAEDS